MYHVTKACRRLATTALRRSTSSTQSTTWSRIIPVRLIPRLTVTSWDFTRQSRPLGGASTIYQLETCHFPFPESLCIQNICTNKPKLLEIPLKMLLFLAFSSVWASFSKEYEKNPSNFYRDPCPESRPTALCNALGNRLKFKPLKLREIFL